MALVRIEITGHDAKVHSPYDANRVEIIKTIPGRAWNKDGRYWTIPASQVATLRSALEAFGDTVVASGNEPPSATTTSHADAMTIARLEREKQRLQQEIIRLKNAQASSAQNWAEQLLRRLSPEQADKVHRTLSRVLHPDVGGDNELMQQLNIARDLLSRLR